MLAAYASAVGGDDPLANLTVGELPAPVPRPGWALVKVRAGLRAGDRFIACELHPQDALALRREFAGDRAVEVRDEDGYHALKALLRDTHGGKPYVSQWGTRMRGTGPYAEMLRIRFERACHRLKLNERRGLWRLDTSQFRPPARPGDQLSLF